MGLGSWAKRMARQAKKKAEQAKRAVEREARLDQGGDRAQGVRFRESGSTQSR